MTVPADWKEAALCHGAARVFFGTGRRVHIAQRMCRACPVQQVCYWDAMAAEARTDLRYGVWGGSTIEQREALHVRHGRPAAAVYERFRDAALVAARRSA